MAGADGKVGVFGAWALYWSSICKFVIKNRHHKDMCLVEIGLCAQNINTISSLIVSTIMKVYVIILDSYDFAS